MKAKLVFFNLVSVDYYSILRWWKRHTLAKAIVALCFLLIFGGMSLSIYFVSKIFFAGLYSFEAYGLLVATYILHASILICIWLGTISAFLAFVSHLLSNESSLQYLLTLPVKPGIIALWLTLRSFISSLFWTLVILLPAGLAATKNPLSLLIVLICTTLISTALGSLLGLLFAVLLRVLRPLLTILIITLFFVISLTAILSVIFPSNLAAIAQLPIQDFIKTFGNLPLNLPVFSTFFLAQSLTSNNQSGLAVVAILSVFTITLSFYVLSRLYFACFRLVHSKSFTYGGRLLRINFTNNEVYSFVLKDLLSVFRSAKELGYALFLLALAYGFFFFLFRSLSARAVGATQLPQVITYSFAWLAFYSIAYLLRLIYPLVAKEGKMAWLVFTSKMKPFHFIIAKIISSLLLSLPLFFIWVFVWFGSPHFVVTNHLIPLQSLLLTINLVIFFTLASFIYPDFTDSEEPERTSTTLVGLVALAASLLFVGLTAISLSSFLPVFLFLFLNCGLVYLVSLQVKHYRF